jgi:hypothetical protein
MDRTTKILLGAIALGLWVNAASLWVRPVSLSAQGQRAPAPVPQDAGQVAAEILPEVQSIARGTCANKKICN